MANEKADTRRPATAEEWLKIIQAANRQASKEGTFILVFYDFESVADAIYRAIDETDCEFARQMATELYWM